MKKIKNDKLIKESKGAFKESLKIVFAKKSIWALAIGVLIGTAISTVISSLASDIIMGSIATALGLSDIKELAYNGIKYGNFIATIMSLIIISITLVILVFAIVFFYNLTVKKELVKNDDNVEKIVIKPSIDEQILQQLKEINEKLK